jgi:alpha-galactosidase
MKALTDYIHCFGLKAGIYTSPGPLTCQRFEGSYGHEALDAQTFAAWGFDLLKYDWCSYGRVFNSLPRNQQNDEARKKPYIVMGTLLATQDRDIVHNLCQYGMAKVWQWGTEAGQSWRVGGDLGHTLTRGGVYNIARKTVEIRNSNGPGSWNDPDYLILGRWTSPFDKAAPLVPVQLTAAEQYSYMSLWCLMACPLFFSGDMFTLDDFTRNILCNTDLIAVNQDRRGQCAEPVRMEQEAWVLKKTLADGSVVVGIFDVANQGDRIIVATWGGLGLTGPQQVRDLWRQKELGTISGRLAVHVGPRGCAVFKLSKAR